MPAGDFQQLVSRRCHAVRAVLAACHAGGSFSIKIRPSHPCPRPPPPKVAISDRVIRKGLDYISAKHRDTVPRGVPAALRTSRDCEDGLLAWADESLPICPTCPETDVFKIVIATKSASFIIIIIIMIITTRKPNCPPIHPPSTHVTHTGRHAAARWAGLGWVMRLIDCQNKHSCLVGKLPRCNALPHSSFTHTHSLSYLPTLKNGAAAAAAATATGSLF